MMRFLMDGLASGVFFKVFADETSWQDRKPLNCTFIQLRNRKGWTDSIQDTYRSDAQAGM